MFASVANILIVYTPTELEPDACVICPVASIFQLVGTGIAGSNGSIVYTNWVVLVVAFAGFPTEDPFVIWAVVQAFADINKLLSWGNWILGRIPFNVVGSTLYNAPSSSSIPPI